MTIADPAFPVRLTVDPSVTHLAFYADVSEPRTIARVNADGKNVVFDWPRIEDAARAGTHLAVMLVAARDAGKRSGIEASARVAENGKDVLCSGIGFVSGHQWHNAECAAAIRALASAP